MTADQRLRRVCWKALSYGVIDFAVIWGWRNEHQQNEAFRTGASKKRWPDSQHNNLDVLGNPNSRAVDVAPWITVGGRSFVPWKEKDVKDHRQYWYLLGGVILAAAAEEDVSLRWGGDWDGDADFTDQTFDDLGHFELGAGEE